MKKLFVLAALASFAFNVWAFSTYPKQLPPVVVESVGPIEDEINPGRPGRFDCVVNHFARVRLSDGRVTRVPVEFAR